MLNAMQDKPGIDNQADSDLADLEMDTKPEDGLAEIAAGSIAMGLGGYLAAKSDAEHYDRERVREQDEVQKTPNTEAEEVAAVLRSYGLTAEESQPVVEALGKWGDKDVHWSSTMKLISRVTNRDMGRIFFTLAEARKRPQSADFLEGFPWLSVTWYKLEQLEVAEFEHLYLFWDGVAWGKPGDLPRRLKEGTQEFMDMVAENISRPHFGHLRDILEQRDSYRAGQTDEKPFLIVVARDVHSPFMLLDGNHRAVAAQWCATESGKQDSVPQHAWMGLSPSMGDYR